MSEGRLWGARFSAQPEAETLAFMSGRDVLPTPPYDTVLIPYDLWGNRAHTFMLGERGIIPSEGRARILQALDTLEEEHAAGRFALDPAREDVHSNIEAYVTELIGIEHAGHIHTGRSRNDQVLTDMRMYLRDQAIACGLLCCRLAGSLLDRADGAADAVMPGFTHHQHATPTTFGHLLEGWAEAQLRGAGRFLAFLSRWDRCPLGAAASYGTTLPIDRALTASLLGFSGPEPNTVDATSSRWEAEADLAHACASAMTHLSQVAQTLILLSTSEFGAIRLDDTYSAGSSIMPQKRNPQSLEAVKAHAVLVRQSVSSLMSLGGSNLFGYNTDQMWTKYIVIDAAGACRASLAVARGVVETLTIDRERMAALCTTGFLGATALVEALVRDAALPFRIAKQVVEVAVAASEGAGHQNVTVEALAEALKGRLVAGSADLAALVACQDAATAVARTEHAGGPAPLRVREAAARAREVLDGLVRDLDGWSRSIRGAETRCRERCRAAIV